MVAAGADSFNGQGRIDCPVMLMSGYDDQTAAHRFGDEPIPGFLQKPFNLEELRETVAQALARSPR